MRNAVRIYLIFKEFADEMNRESIAAFASSMAFFVFLSLFPMMMLFVSVIPYTPLTESMLVADINAYLPEILHVTVTNTVAEIYEHAYGMLPISIIITIISAGKGMLALIRGLNVINDVNESRNIIILRIIASVYTVVFMIAILAMLILSFFSKKVIIHVTEYEPYLGGLIRVFMPFRYLVGWFVLSVFFLLMYTYIPSKKLSLKRQIPGACFSAALWNIASFAFSIYLDRFNGFGAYGSLAVIMVLLVYLYMMMYILLIGAHINKFFGPIYKFLFGWTQYSKKK